MENYKFMKRFVVLLALAGASSLGLNAEKPKNLEQISQTSIKKPVKKVVIDAGHGMGNRKQGVYDPGAVVENYQESKIVLSQARIIKSKLENLGYEVLLTRENDKTPAPLSSRTKGDYDLFVSLHCNAAENKNAEGVETYFSNEESRKLADHVQKNLVSEIQKAGHKVKNRGVKQNSFQVLKGSRPSVLVESGFLTNSNDRKYLTDSNPEVETAIVNGIHEYFQRK